MSYMKSTVTPSTATSFDAAAFAELVREMTMPPAVATPAVMPSYTTVSAPKGKTLTAKARVNKATIERGGTTYTFNKVKQKLVKDLLQQLMNTGVVKITSETSLTGAVTFTATVVANETA